MWSLIIFSTIISYGVGWKSDPLRTMAPYQPLSLLAVYAICLKPNGPLLLWTPKKRKVQKKKTNSKSDKKINEQILIQNFSLKTFNLRILTCFIIFGIFLTLPFQISSDRSDVLVRTCKSISAIELIPQTLDYRSVKKLDLPVNYWWSEAIKELSPGYLIQGLGKDFSHYNLFLPSNANLQFSKKGSYCFAKVENLGNKNALDALGYIEVSQF